MCEGSPYIKKGLPPAPASPRQLHPLPFPGRLGLKVKNLTDGGFWFTDLDSGSFFLKEHANP
jgi:hypothetical protein